MNMRTTITTLAFAAATAAGFSMPAHATVQAAPAVACGDSLTALLNAGYVACMGPLAGSPGGSVSFDGVGTFERVGQTGDASGAFTGSPGATDFGILDLAGAPTGSFVIGLQGAATYSLYLFDASGPSSIVFDTFGIADALGRAGPALAGASLFALAAPVPEPATTALLLAGLGAVGAAVRRRQGVAPRA